MAWKEDIDIMETALSVEDSCSLGGFSRQGVMWLRNASGREDSAVCKGAFASRLAPTG
ncbi:hypothetical protein BR1R3_22050 [Pseudomonas atacamensis]|nr:hypothetical protein BR1R3_22050 [Pseudomonas atacamensis]